MKKFLAVALLAGASSMSYADPDAGCGLGSALWAGQSGLLPKVLAATTNGIFGNQTFGISTGTLGCSHNGTVSSSVRLTMFTGSNIEKLARDMSVGQGETLNVMADLMGVQAQDKWVVGQSVPLTGSNARFGNDIRSGAQAYFAMLNARGGVQGKPVELVSLDDRNDRKQAGVNARQLLDDKSTLALFGFASATLSLDALPQAPVRPLRP